MAPRRPLVAIGLLAGAAAGTVLAWRSLARATRGRAATLRSNVARMSMPDARSYDLGTLLGRPLYDRIAGTVAAEAVGMADAGAAARSGEGVGAGSGEGAVGFGEGAAAAVLDVGCGPGQLAILLARRAPSLRVTGMDLDEGMIERATANADREFDPSDPSRPAFAVGDSAAMPFPDRSFDLVVSTFSVHHWEDPAGGLAEIHRVLRPGGRALIWDFAGLIRRHSVSGMGPVELAAASPFGTAIVARRWGFGPIVLAERYDLERPAAPQGAGGMPDGGAASMA